MKIFQVITLNSITHDQFSNKCDVARKCISSFFSVPLPFHILFYLSHEIIKEKKIKKNKNLKPGVALFLVYKPKH